MERIHTSLLIILIYLTSCAPTGVYISGGGIAPSQYGPVYEETGFHGAAEYYKINSELIVNHFGGNLIVSNSDVNIPSIGDFNLHFTRHHNSGGKLGDQSRVGVLRATDSPLGVGWTGHYGYLRYSSSNIPEYFSGSGARERFFRHDEPSLANLRPTDINPNNLWVSSSMKILIRETSNRFWLYEPNGRKHRLDYEVGGIFVPQVIMDKAGNKWNLTYFPRWYTYYENHPIVDQIYDEETPENRVLDFRYSCSPDPDSQNACTINNKPRLESIYLNNIQQSKYNYVEIAGLHYLWKHLTPMDQITEYEYYDEPFTPAQYKQGALKKVTYPTGGTKAIDYDKKRFYSPQLLSPQRYSEVLSVKTINDGTHIWQYEYPTEIKSRNEFEVIVNGPEGFVGKYKYYTYEYGGCSNTELWKVGKILHSSEEYNGSEQSKSISYSNPLKLSNQAYWSECTSLSKPYIGLIGNEQETYKDGAANSESYGISYQEYDTIYPKVINRTGNISQQIKYQNIINIDNQHHADTNTYLLGIVKEKRTTIDGNEVNKTIYREYNNKGLPKYIDAYQTSSDFITIKLEYWTELGKNGAIKEKSIGSYYEKYNYDNGILKSIEYPDGPGMMRDIITDTGLVGKESIFGVERRYDYNNDGRLEKITNPHDSQITINYPPNKAVMNQGNDIQIEYEYDGFGRQKFIRETINAGNLATTEYRYNGLGFKTLEITPKNLNISMTYDVKGRLRSRISNEETYIIDYDGETDGIKKKITKNGSIETTEKRDFYGRLISGSTNGEEINYTYEWTDAGIKKTISSNSISREIIYDYFGNKLKESHPEYAEDITYVYDSRGWLEEIRKPEGDISITYWDDGRIKTRSRVGYSSLVENSYNPEYGELEVNEYGDVIKSYSNYDNQGRPRTVSLLINGPFRPNAPHTTMHSEHVSEAIKAEKISAGGGHTCAVMENGGVRCWGYGGSGALGYGNTNNVHTPDGLNDVTIEENVVDVTTGYSHSCVLLENGSVRCWGRGVRGALGYGNHNSIGDDETPDTVGPVQVGGKVIKIAAGGSHTCALLEDGTVRCWGANSWGQLGYGHMEDIGDDEIPARQPPVQLGGPAKDISVGSFHTCALLEDGTMQCWGKAFLGQLGYGNIEHIGDNERPIDAGPVPLLLSGETISKIISNHGRRKVILVTPNNNRGLNAENKITTYLQEQNIQIVGRAKYNSNRRIITDVSFQPNLSNIIDTAPDALVFISFNDKHTVSHLQSIIRNHSHRPLDIPIYLYRGEPLKRIASISAGNAHTCAHLEDGTIRCWGYGYSGQLGNGLTNTIGDNETAEMSRPALLGGNAVHLDTGGYFTCAILENGTIRCFGKGKKGRLGYGNERSIGNTPTSTPEIEGPVPIGGPASVISTGESHACAILADKTIRCWGDGSGGRLGLDNTINIGDNETPNTQRLVGERTIVEPTLRWVAVEGATGYDIEMKEDSTTQTLFRQSSGEVCVRELGVDYIPTRQYHFRVRAIEENWGPGPWSAWRVLGDVQESIINCGQSFGGDQEFITGIEYKNQNRVKYYDHPTSDNRRQEFIYATGADAKEVKYNGNKIIEQGIYEVSKKMKSFKYSPFSSFRVTLDFTFDDLNRIKTQLAKVGPSTVLNIPSITYNDWGYIDNLVRNDGIQASFEHSYGSQGELDKFKIKHGTQSATIDYQYDSRGNLKAHNSISFSGFSIPSFTADFNNNNHNLLHEYDNAGRLVVNESYRFIYNSLDRISHIYDAESNVLVESYEYDGEGNRVRIDTKDRVIYYIRAPNGGLLSQIEYSPNANGCWELENETDYVYFNGYPALIVVRDRNSIEKRQYVLRDFVGSPVVIFNENNSFQPEYRVYSPYGSEMLRTSSTTVTHEYSGHERDKTTQLNYVTSRHYNSKGRFNRPDSAMYFEPKTPKTQNLYLYARLNPTNYVDISGEEPQKVGTRPDISFRCEQTISQGKPISSSIRAENDLYTKYYQMPAGVIVIDKPHLPKDAWKNTEDAIFLLASPVLGPHTRFLVYGLLFAHYQLGDIDERDVLIQLILQRITPKVRTGLPGPIDDIAGMGVDESMESVKSAIEKSLDRVLNKTKTENKPGIDIQYRSIYEGLYHTFEQPSLFQGP